MTMTCHDAESLLHDALDAPLPPADAAAQAAHLDTCAACRDLEADLALMRDATRGLDRPIVPAQAWTRLSTQLEREGLIASASAATRSRTSWRGYAWMVVAASLPIGANVFLFAQRYRTSEALITASVVVSTVMALISLSIVMALAGRL